MNSTSENSEERVNNMVAKMRDFDQENSHHKLTLLRHCLEATVKMSEMRIDVNRDLFMAAYCHDCGKLYTKTFYNKKGELDKEAHYYNHQNVGAYEMLCPAKVTNFNVLKISALICYHMHPYFWENNPKMEEKYKRLWGEDFYNDILLLHEADLAAH